jgi:hypothetical protein
MSFTALPAERVEIEATVQSYIDGFLGRDTALLNRAFHQDAKLMACDQGAIAATPVADWFVKIDERRRAGGAAPTATSRVVGIDQHGDAAVARVHLVFKEYEYTDYLALLKTEAGWKIATKIYTTQPLLPPA